MREGTIIVTGASRGIGAAIATRLHRAGRDVACLSRSGEAPAGVGIPCDVTDEASIREAIGAVAARGRVAGLVNNAGQHAQAPAATITAEAFDGLMRLNATSMLLAARETYPHLKAAGGGLIVNMGSFFDKLGVPHNVAYAASKAAVAAISRCLAVEWAADGIRVVTVAPGYVETDLNREYLADEKVRRWLERRVPAGRPGDADEVAALVEALYAADIGYLTGETIYLDGGMGMNH